MGLFGALWGSWGPLGVSWELLGASWGPLGLLGSPRALSGRKARIFDSWSPSWAPLGTVLGLSWVVLGLGRLLDRLGSWVLGRSRAAPGQSWGLFGPSSGGTIEKARMPKKKIKNQLKINDFCILGPSREASWGVLEASWAVWRPSWASSSDLSATGGPLGASWGPLGALLARLGGFLEAPGAPGVR